MFYITYGGGKYAHKYSFVPVNCTLEDEIANYFDKTKHRSHLLDCPELQSKWAEVTTQIRYSLLKEEENAKHEKFDTG